MKNIKEMTMEEIKNALGYDFKLVTEHSKVQLHDITVQLQERQACLQIFSIASTARL